MEKMVKIVKRVSKHAKEIRREILKQFLNLSTSGFGLVAALAWNELIKEIINEYVKPIVGESSGIVSLFLYASIVTTLAVIVTYNLTRVLRKS